jgi:hypothetical protein
LLGGLGGEAIPETALDDLLESPEPSADDDDGTQPEEPEEPR